MTGGTETPLATPKPTPCKTESGPRPRNQKEVGRRPALVAVRPRKGPGWDYTACLAKQGQTECHSVQISRQISREHLKEPCSCIGLPLAAGASICHEAQRKDSSDDGTLTKGRARGAGIEGRLLRPKRQLLRPNRQQLRPKRQQLRPKRQLLRPKRQLLRPKRQLLRPNKKIPSILTQRERTMQGH